MTQLRKKVEFKTNLPVLVALAYDDGVLKQDGRYGDYWIYTLIDERVMFVPPAVHDRIRELNITRGQAFTVTKQEKRVGNRRVIEWAVDFPDDNGPNGAQPSAHRQCSPRTLPEQAGAAREKQPDLLREQETPQQQPAPAGEPDPAAPTTTEPAASATPQATAPNGHAAGQNPPPPNGGSKVNGAAQPNGRAPQTDKSNTSPLFRASMRAAIDALIDAERYAAERNYSVRFSNEDLRATAISIFIAVRDRSSQ